MYLICIYVIGNEKKQILELFNMKLSKTIDQTHICKKSYDDPLGYFCMGLFFFTCTNEQVTNKFHLSNGCFHLSRTIGQTLLSRPDSLINHCDRRITHLSDTDTVQSETYLDKSL